MGWERYNARNTRTVGQKGMSEAGYNQRAKHDLALCCKVTFSRLHNTSAASDAKTDARGISVSASIRLTTPGLMRARLANEHQLVDLRVHGLSICAHHIEPRKVYTARLA